MLGDVLGNYLDHIEEREFDAPFIALLVAQGFYDIHFLHGAFEFGKDFIAKHNHDGAPLQYAFQTKAGNLGLSDWNSCRGQVDMLRTNSLAHPAFDTSMARQAVFVTTGRLVGGAALAAQDYRQHLLRLGETEFAVWDRETLIEKISQAPETSLSGASEGALLAALGKADEGSLQDSDLEAFSRRWIDGRNAGSLVKASVEATIISNRLRRNGRTDLACMAGILLIRAAWALRHGTFPPAADAIVAADLGRKLFRHYALAVRRVCGSSGLTPQDIISAHAVPSANITYAIRCARIGEILGLLGLLDEEPDSLHSTVAAVSKLVELNPGFGHPASDKWASSLPPAILLLHRAGRSDLVRSALQTLIRWIGDRYENSGLGLADVYAVPDSEVEYLLGAPFEHTAVQRRGTSYLATVVLDLLCVLEMPDLYEVAQNDFLAVGAIPTFLEILDDRDQYSHLTNGAVQFLNLRYPDNWDPTDNWKLTAHHKRSSDFYLNRLGRQWDHLALCSVLRDRHFLHTWRTFAKQSAK